MRPPGSGNHWADSLRAARVAASRDWNSGMDASSSRRCCGGICSVVMIDLWRFGRLWRVTDAGPPATWRTRALVVSGSGRLFVTGQIAVSLRSGHLEYRNCRVYRVMAGRFGSGDALLDVAIDGHAEGLADGRPAVGLHQRRAVGRAARPASRRPARRDRAGRHAPGAGLRGADLGRGAWTHPGSGAPGAEIPSRERGARRL